MAAPRSLLVLLPVLGLALAQIVSPTAAPRRVRGAGSGVRRPGSRQASVQGPAALPPSPDSPAPGAVRPSRDPSPLGRCAHRGHPAPRRGWASRGARGTLSREARPCRGQQRGAGAGAGPGSAANPGGGETMEPIHGAPEPQPPPPPRGRRLRPDAALARPPATSEGTWGPGVCRVAGADGRRPDAHWRPVWFEALPRGSSAGKARAPGSAEPGLGRGWPHRTATPGRMGAVLGVGCFEWEERTGSLPPPVPASPGEGERAPTQHPCLLVT